MRFLLTGGQGKLAAELRSTIRKAGHEVVAFGKSQLDVRDVVKVSTALNINKPDIVINCAGVLSLESERDHKLAWDTNVNGAANVALACRVTGIRVVHISTDYVFSGDRGNYSESEPPDPVNYYGLTKAVGEAVVLVNRDTDALVLRAPFRYNGPWKYPRAFVDQFVSARFIPEVAIDIREAALDRGLRGILHIGGPRKSVLDLAVLQSPVTGAMFREEFREFRIPGDVSLDSSLWKRHQAEKLLAARV